jgi:hypothetical protein
MTFQQFPPEIKDHIQVTEVNVDERYQPLIFNPTINQ